MTMNHQFKSKDPNQLLRRWEICAPVARDISRSLAAHLNISDKLATLLMTRGYGQHLAAMDFLCPDLKDVQSPHSLNGMSVAVERLQVAQSRKESVGIFGDYDVDGIASTALLMSALKQYGIDVAYRLPRRLSEGYGVSRTGLAELIEGGASLIITVDCGVSSVNEIKWAKEQGVDTIVCDHHIAPPVLPPALSIINPKIEPNDHLFSDLAGAAVAMKLAWALFGELQPEWLGLAALGTVADVMPLVGENRVIVKEGLNALADPKLMGIRALCEVSGVDHRSIDAGAIAFRLAPRLNAPGRLGSADKSVELLLAEDRYIAYDLALELDTLNKTRQQIEASVLHEAREMAEADLAARDDKAIVVWGDNWHPGVVGIVASRLVDQWHRPVLAIALEGNDGQGSGRGVQQFSLFEALARCAPHLASFGGHDLAAGFTIEKKNLVGFKKAFVSHATEVIMETERVLTHDIDCETTLSSLDMPFARELQLLAPFGHGNPEPLFMIRNAQVQRLRTIGKDSTHLRMELRQDQLMLPAVAFGLGSMHDQIGHSDSIDAIGRLNINNWQGLEKSELQVVDIRTNDCLLEILCHPEDPDAPQLLDRRGRSDFQGFTGRAEDVLLDEPPSALADLKKGLSNITPGKRIVLQYNHSHTKKKKADIEHLYLDREFLVQVFQRLKDDKAQSIAIDDLSDMFPNTPHMHSKLRYAVAVLRELELVELFPSVQEPSHVSLNSFDPGEKKNLESSHTFREIQVTKKRALAMLQFFDSASPRKITEVLARLWQR